MNADALRDALVQDEGCVLTVYDDSMGVPTIGVGRNLRDRGITKSEAMLLLDHDISECVADLAASFAWFTPLDDVRQNVLLNMRFQLGAAGFRGFKRMLAAVAQQDYAGAADEMKASQWAAQVPARAARLELEMRTGDANAGR